MYFRNYRLRKRGFDKCLKNLAPEYFSTNKMVNGQKHCWNMDEGTFTIFLDQSEDNSIGKSLR